MDRATYSSVVIELKQDYKRLDRATYSSVVIELKQDYKRLEQSVHTVVQCRYRAEVGLQEIGQSYTVVSLQS